MVAAATARGPLVSACPSVDASSLPPAATASGDALSRHLACGHRSTPIVVRDLARSVVKAWSFDALAARCDSVIRHSGTQQLAQTGLIEQGKTASKTAVEPARYLRDLHAQEASGAEVRSLLPAEHKAALDSGGSVSLDWGAVASDGNIKTYLGHWDIFRYLPSTATEWAPLASSTWPRRSLHWDFAWAGPSGTFTGLHYDMPNNWFFQMRGVKEFVLFGRDQKQHLPISAKYDPGARLACVDVTRLDDSNQDDAAIIDSFTAASGWYVRLHPGDALFIPKQTYHMVHALSPSLSVSSFGHSPLELVTNGAWIETRDALHRAGLLGWGNCACHGANERRPRIGLAIAGATLAAALHFNRLGS
jgi:Cupin-like domain